MWIWRRCASAAWLGVILGACAADDAGGGTAVDVGPGRDATTDAQVCPPGELAGPRGCEPLPVDVCPVVDALELGCADRDGDCFVADCPRAPKSLVDCDDGQAAVGPGRPELCDGIDNDCDGLADEGFEKGRSCTACGEGKTECSVADPRTTACSTEAGQSEAAGAPEQCNGVDDDCDGQVDEACQVDTPAIVRTAVALCGDDVLLIEGEARSLVRRSLVGGEPELLDAGPAAAPACEGDLFAWLKVTADRPCTEAGPAVCPQARLFARVGDASTQELTGLGDLGPPVVAGGYVYWHSVLEGGPVLQRRAPGGLSEPLFEGAAASDPSRPVGGRVAVRTWEAGPRVVVEGLDGARGLVVEGPAAPAGPPALDAAWVAWVVEGQRPAVWVVPLDRPRDGLQLTSAGHPQGRPWLDAGRLYWLDTDGLRRFDLTTGDTRTVVPGLAGPVDVVGGRIVWVAGEALFIEVEAP